MHSDAGFAQALFPLRAKQQKNRNSKRSDDQEMQAGVV
jgi:hypothetical protein